MSRAIVISGVRTGMGRALALKAAARGQRVFGCSSSPLERLREDPELAALLEAGTLTYRQADVADAAQLAVLCQAVQDACATSPFEALDVVANAGVARWGDPADPEAFQAIERMRAINVGGTRHLAQVFQPLLARHAPAASFVAMSSIVAAEGRSIAGNTDYMATKLEAQYYATGSLVHAEEFAGVRTFAVAPGVVPTPMIMDELLLPLVFRAALATAGHDAAVAAALRPELPPDTEVSGASAAQLARASLHDVIEAEPGSFERWLSSLEDDPELTRRGMTGLMRKARQPGAVRDRVLHLLYALDLAVTPELVAERLLDQLGSDELPPKRLLKVYSRGDDEPILRLLQAM